METTELQLEIDPTFKDLMPSLKIDEYCQLKDNILKDGEIRDPLVLWKGTNKIVDGYNRYKIARDHNMKFRTVEKEFVNVDAVKEFIIKNQFGRRNLTKYQRAKLALSLQEIFQKKAKEKQIQAGKVKEKSPEPAVVTREEVAKCAEQSTNTIEKVKYIEENAPVEIKKELEENKISINKAYTKIKPKKDKPKEIKHEWFDLRTNVSGHGQIQMMNLYIPSLSFTVAETMDIKKSNKLLKAIEQLQSALDIIGKITYKGEIN